MERTCVFVCVFAQAHTPASACLCPCMPTLLLYTKEKILISEKSRNSSTVAAESKVTIPLENECEKRRKKGKRKGRQRDREAESGGNGRVREREQEINEEAERERQRVLPVSELSLYSRPPLWSYSREQSTSPSDLASSHSLEHTHSYTHTLCNEQREQSSCLLPCVCGFKWYGYVRECVCVFVCTSYYSSLTSYFSSLRSVPPPCLPAACNKNTEISKDQPASLSLSFILLHTHTLQRNTVCLEGRHELRWFSLLFSSLQPTHPPQQRHFLCLLIT